MIPIRLYVYAGAAIAVAGALWGFGYHQKQQGRAEVQAKFDAYVTAQQLAQTQANSQAQEAALQRFKAVERAAQNDQKTAQTLRAANALARTELERLRDKLAAIDRATGQDGTASAEAGTDDSAAIARKLLGECAAEYEAVAGGAGELAAQVLGLQRFILATADKPAGTQSTTPTAQPGQTGLPP